VKICIGCADPGGPETEIVDPLELCDVLDYYELQKNGEFEHVAQTRKCLGGCADLVESIVKRGVEMVVVISLSPNSLLKLSNSGVRVYRTENPSVKVSLDLPSRDKLVEIDRSQFSKMAKM
jgi:predicted Fe-Mo cluster-binding NifX family protein